MSLFLPALLGKVGGKALVIAVVTPKSQSMIAVGGAEFLVELAD